MDPPPGARAVHVIELDRRERFVAPPDEVWAWIGRTERFPTWWRWLKEFESEGEGLQSGGVLRGLLVWGHDQVIDVPVRHFRETVDSPAR